MARYMKIVYACLILSLSGCGGSGGDAAAPATPAPEKPSVKTQGEGELVLKNSDSKKIVLKLKSGEKDGSVYCERKGDDSATFALGEFFLAPQGMKEHIPTTGLTFSLEKVTEAGSKDLSDVVFNIDDSFPSSPLCTLDSKGIVDSKFSGEIRCVDNVERGEWGYLSIKAQFSCSM